MIARAVGRASAAAALGALLGVVSAAVLYAWHPVLRIDFLTDPPPHLVTGFYPGERDPASQMTFAWSGPETAIRLPDIDRRVDWTMKLRVRGGRPSAADNPELQVFSDGVFIATLRTGPEFDETQVVIPAHPQHRRGAVLTLRSTKTFVPGPSDPRALGVMVDWIEIRPTAPVLAPRAALAAAGASAAILSAAVALLGVTPGSAIGTAAVVSVMGAAGIGRGFGPYTAFPGTAVQAAGWIGLGLALLAGLIQRRGRAPLRNTARFAAAFSACALFLKLLLLLHPDMPVNDAMFHAHRFQGVLAGRFFFTSEAPGGYLFPYPPGFYVFASAFATLVRRGAADVALLRIVACCVDTGVAVLLYHAIVIAWRDRLAAAIAVALYLLTPLDFTILSTANLTNAFAQSVAVAALVLMAARTVRTDNLGMTGLLAVVLAAAYLSHTSTFALLFVATIAAALLFVMRGGPVLRAAAAAIVLATLVAAALAVALYYAHFISTYRTEFARLGSETAQAAPDAGGRTIADRLAVVPMFLQFCFGFPLLALAAGGAWRMYAGGAADRLTLAIAGWALSCVLFLIVGIVTPMDMRYYLAAIPVVAAAAAVGAARGWRAGREWRVLAAVLLAGCVWTAVSRWWGTLG